MPTRITRSYPSIANAPQLLAHCAILLFFGVAFVSSAKAQSSLHQSREVEAHIVSAPTASLRPQAQAPAYKTAGKDFFIAFPSSIGSDIAGDLPYKRLYISSRAEVHGTIRLLGGAWSQSFVTDPLKTISVDLPSWAGLERSETEKIYKRVFEVTADDEIAIYALSHHHLSTDGFLVLPKEALGEHYAIASTRNSLYYYGGRALPFNAYTFDTVPRSECLIVGTEDGTTVELTPSADSYTGIFKKGQTYSFTINSGETMQICARDTGVKSMLDGILKWTGKLAGIDCDLSGTLISSDKPIAVFSGNERASTPDSLEFSYSNHPNVSRDHVIDQMPPIENWGKTFAFIPSSRGSSKKRPASGDILRLVSASDNTVIAFNGTPVTTLAQGTSAEFSLNKATLITSSQPLLAVKYLQSANDPDTLGDPDMTVLPPIENMSLFYTLPTLSGNGSFTEHYVAILCDSAARTTTTINGYQLDQTKLYVFPGTRYYYSVVGVGTGTQRVESTLPCYAESYGYGNLDSYTFSGGGSFPYITSLRAVDLDFGSVPIASVRDSTTDVIAANVPLQLSEQPEVYKYSWEFGDTLMFAVLDTIRSVTPINPGSRLPVLFRFNPTHAGRFRATLRVWSNNHSPVVINVTGIASDASKLVVDPLDFGRVRIGDTVRGAYRITNFGGSPVTLLNPNVPAVGRPDLFHLHPILTKSSLGIQNVIDWPGSALDTVDYSPLAHSFDASSAPIISTLADTPRAVFTGRGVDYELRPTTIDFGDVRLRTATSWNSATYLDSNWNNRTITNYGDDSVGITSITLVGGDTEDFEIDYLSPKSNHPPPVSPRWLLDTLLGTANANTYRIRFAPKYDVLSGAIDTGVRVAFVKIVTDDDRQNRRVRFDTVLGVGVEPYLVVTKPSLEFGIFVNPTQTVSTLYDTLENIGSYYGVIDSLRNSDPTSYRVTANTIPVPDGSTLGVGSRVALQIDFNILRTGEFFDTIYTHNDSRNTPLVALHAVVRADLANQLPLSLDSISSCDPIDTVYDLRNVGNVRIVIDTITFAGDSGGFSFTDFSKLRFPVSIAGDSIFSLHLQYLFPVDSLNGTQVAKMILQRTSFGSPLSFEYDTVDIILTRTINQLELQSEPPPFSPSAGDVPFRMPIYLKGNRLGVGSLDDETIRVQFGNDMITPIGIDRTGSLTDESQPGIPPQPLPYWDAATRSYYVPMLQTNLSQNITSNTLLFTLLCKPYLTTDTLVDATVSVAYTEKPCGFRVAPKTLQIDYANECGNRTIRDLLIHGSTDVISISGAFPNPVDLSSNDAIQVEYKATAQSMISWQLIDEKGVIVYEHPVLSIAKGTGSIVIPRDKCSTSGLYFLRLIARDASGAVQKIVRTQFSVLR